MIVEDFRTAGAGSVSGTRGSYGLRACWSVPILSLDRRVLGTFALYFGEPRSPSQQDANHLEQFRDLASIAIERTQAENALRRSRAYLAEAQRLSLTGSFSWRPATGAIDLVGGDLPDLRARSGRQANDGFGPRAGSPGGSSRFFQQTAERAIREGKDFAFEHRLQFPGGAVKHLQIMAHRSSMDSTSPGVRRRRHGRHRAQALRGRAGPHAPQPGPRVARQHPGTDGGLDRPRDQPAAGRES